MRVPLSWLRELVTLPDGMSGRDIADRLIRAGLEVETVDEVGGGLLGPIVVGRVLSVDVEEHSNGKSIRWCRVDVGEGHNEPKTPDQPAGRSIVCGASNFGVHDLVVVALPGAELPGGFAIAARKTYGHLSDGMICSTRELGAGDDHDGIWVLPDGFAAPGDEAVSALGLRDDVLDVAVTPDRGYAESMRGIAREAAIAFDVPFLDPADVPLPAAAGDDWRVVVEDRVGCDRFVSRSVTGIDVTRASPLWLQRRVQLAGMRPISLAVDITNYVMLELGQPLHAYDRSRLSGPIVVRPAQPGEVLETLDGTKRTLNAEDLLITDASGPIGVAGVMGGASTEISGATTDIVIESAHFDPVTIARGARRHKLPSEASRRFARGVDTRLQEVAAERAVQLLAELGGAVIGAGRTVIDHASPAPEIEFDLTLPARVVGLDYSQNEVQQHLVAVGCTVVDSELVGSGAVGAEGGRVLVTAPSWRPDLLLPADLVEEVARVHGYDSIPSVLPRAPAGSGFTDGQRLRRRVGLALAGAGFTEVLSYPFLSPAVHDEFGLPADDARRRALRLANPLSEEEPELRTSLLPGLLAVLRRNVGRGFDDLALFDSGLVFRPESLTVQHPAGPPRPSVDRRPTDGELAALDALLPRQPRRVAVVLTGKVERAGWWGAGRAAEWGDAVDAAHIVAGAAGLRVQVSQDDHAPWHPGRCAALHIDEELLGHAGELHPRVLGAMGLPLGTCAMELELDVIERRAAGVTIAAPDVSSYPVAKEDVSLIVANTVPAAAVTAALLAGGSGLVESVTLFDVFTGEQVGAGNRSLAYALRFRAADRTLTTDEVTAARDAAVAEASRRTGATQRASS